MTSIRSVMPNFAATSHCAQPMPRLRQDCAQPCHISARIGLAPFTSASGSRNAGIDLRIQHASVVATYNTPLSLQRTTCAVAGATWSLAKYGLSSTPTSRRAELQRRGTQGVLKEYSKK